jgi:hypothetical protein
LTSGDIFIEEDFRTRLENIKDWLGDGVIADYDDPIIEKWRKAASTRAWLSVAM